VVKATRAAAGPGSLRPLNTPQPVQVETDGEGYPVTFLQRGNQRSVARIEDIWRVEDEWWRGEPVVRTYFEVLTEDGRRVTLFLDHMRRRWFQQRYD
jgi:hypothetical protein